MAPLGKSREAQRAVKEGQQVQAPAVASLDQAQISMCLMTVVAVPEQAASALALKQLAARSPLLSLYLTTDRLSVRKGLSCSLVSFINQSVVRGMDAGS